MLTVLNLLSYAGQPAAARQFVSYCLHALSLIMLLLSYAINLLSYATGVEIPEPKCNTSFLLFHMPFFC